MQDFQEYAEDASYWLEIAEDVDVVGELPDVFRVTGEVANVLANNAVGFAFDMARHIKYFYMHNDTVLDALFSMELNSNLYGLSDTASVALVEIRENYSDYYSGIENKMMIAIGETALDGLLDTATGLFKVAVKLMGFAEVTSPDWAEGVNRISSYDTIAKYCRRGYEKEINGTLLSSVQDIRGLAYMYLYSCEQNWKAMEKYAIKQGNLELAEKYKANAIAAEEWQAKFLEVSPAEQNDSHEYGDATGDTKKEYTEKLKEMFANITLYTSAVDMLFDETYWVWSTGETAGSQYVALFHKNGTMEYCRATNQDYGAMSYSYDNDLLTVNGVDYRWDGEYFLSTEKLESQTPEGTYYSFSLDSNGTVWRSLLEEVLDVRSSFFREMEQAQNIDKRLVKVKKYVSDILY